MPEPADRHSQPDPGSCDSPLGYCWRRWENNVQISVQGGVGGNWAELGQGGELGGFLEMALKA